MDCHALAAVEEKLEKVWSPQGCCFSMAFPMLFALDSLDMFRSLELVDH
jgi:hypothetical protein